MGVYITTFDNNLMNDIGISYTSNIEIENETSYNPSFNESLAESEEITLQLLLYNKFKNEAIEWSKDEVQKIYDWLITDDFVEFISDDNSELKYYFKTVKISKYLSYGNKGIINVTFKPYSQYCYKELIIDKTVTTPIEISIYNPSSVKYRPIIEITNLGDTSTVNKINNMNITNLETNQKIIIDNLMLLVQDESGNNSISKCNRKWITLNEKTNNTIFLDGNMSLKIICEFPLIR